RCARPSESRSRHGARNGSWAVVNPSPRAVAALLLPSEAADAWGGDILMAFASRLPVKFGFISLLAVVPVAAQVTDRVSVSDAGVEGNSSSELAAISADGRFVAFASLASNLVPGDTNDVSDVFVHDRLTGRIERVSVDSRGREGDAASGLIGVGGYPAISA